MSLMKKLMAQFDDEIEGVSEYVKCAMENKEDPELYKMYNDMAMAELGHAKSIHAQIVKRTSEDPSPEDAVKALKDIWADKHSDMLEDLAKAKSYIEMSK